MKNQLLFPYRCYRYGLFKGGWLPSHLATRLKSWTGSVQQVTDVMVVLVDHYEPSSKIGDEAAIECVDEWCQSYIPVADKFRDSDDRPPQHTWFYRAEYPNVGCIRRLSECVYDGFGEVEFHLHHGFDDHNSFSKKLKDGLCFFNQVGAMLTGEPEPQKRFAYIAGNWALDNGAGDDSKSGCDTELRALREAGCYADFTFPAIGSAAQPKQTNSIYYAAEDDRPKSYNTGTPLRVGGSPSGDLLIFQGPVWFDLLRGTVEAAAIEAYSPANPSRLRYWESARVHVHGRPEWMFVKLHCHSMQSKKIFRGDHLHEYFDMLVAKWRGGGQRLHFCTAREAYNICKAAEAGESGNAGDFRDYEIPPPVNRYLWCSEAFEVNLFSSSLIKITLTSSNPATLKVRLPWGDEALVQNCVGPLEFELRDKTVLFKGQGDLRVSSQTDDSRTSNPWGHSFHMVSQD